MEMEVIDSDGFMARFLAFRQYVEFMLEVLPTKTAKTKLCRLSVRREKLCSDVIGHFGFHEGQCRAFPKQKLFQRTSVVFVDANGDEEEGNRSEEHTSELQSPI